MTSWSQGGRCKAQIWIQNPTYFKFEPRIQDFMKNEPQKIVLKFESRFQPILTFECRTLPFLEMWIQHWVQNLWTLSPYRALLVHPVNSPLRAQCAQAEQGFALIWKREIKSFPTVEQYMSIMTTHILLDIGMSYTVGKLLISTLRGGAPLLEVRTYCGIYSISIWSIYFSGPKNQVILRCLKKKNASYIICKQSIVSLCTNILF